MENTKTTKTTIKRILFTIAFPIVMFLVMLIVTLLNEKSFVNGDYIFLTNDFVIQVLIKSCMTIAIGLVIWLQLKNGRFDFSIGATMILTAIIAGNIGRSLNSPLIALLVAIIFGVIFSMITGLVYVFGKVPIVITTIGMTLLYESLTYLVFDGKGVTTFYSNSSTSIFGRIPLIFIPTALAVIVFIIFNNYSVVGRKNKILANNQLAGVNIGISERKSVLWSYFYSGLIVGFAAIIYVSQNSITPQSGLSTAGIMFSYIVPVFMGLFIGKYSQDFIGIIVAAIGMQIMYYGLETINLVGGWQQIIMGLFVFGFYAYSSQYDRISKKINDLRLKFKKTID